MFESLENIRLTERPLVVCDVDDVVLEFVTPFRAFLASRGLRLIPRSFRLHGNIVGETDDTPVEADAVSALLEGFFAEQEQWQSPFSDATGALRALSDTADLIFLTAMPPQHFAARRRLLDRFGFTYPLIAAKEAKGPLVRCLHGERALPVAFIDDMVHNLHSVGEHLPQCLLVHLPPPIDIHQLAPPAGDRVRRARDWPEALGLISAHLAG